MSLLNNSHLATDYILTNSFTFTYIYNSPKPNNLIHLLCFTILAKIIHVAIIGVATTKDIDDKMIKLFEISIVNCSFCLNQSEIKQSEGSKNQ